LIVIIDGLIGWCLMPTLTVFQLYRGMNTFYRLTVIPQDSKNLTEKKQQQKH
jgi:hypothetical protein